ncbi:MAG: fibronectin type III domain-containing protein [Bacteroidales bacterium]|nr:fibronectin type III domain-containing protein [Bacteroidales bacterium]
MRTTFKAVMTAFVTMLGFAASAQNLNYSTGFENSADTTGWVLLGNSHTNHWAIGTAEHSAGSHALYISSDNGATATYSPYDTSYVYAYYQFTLQSAAALEISFNWKCYGETNYDYLWAFLVPSSATLTPGLLPDGTSDNYSFATSPMLPSGWVDVSNGKLNLSNSWENFFVTTNVSAGTWRLVFMWCNDGSVGSSPAACVDNVTIFEPTCPRPGNLTFSNITSDSCTLSWHERGQATSWVIEYADSAFAPGCYQGTTVYAYDTIYTLDNLQPQTRYYVYVHADCGSDTSANISGTFITGCVPVAHTNLPISQGFENTTDDVQGLIDNCWQFYYMLNGTLTEGIYNSGYSTGVYFSTTYAASGAASLYFYTSYYSSLTSTYVVMPAVEDSVGGLDLTFKMYNSSSTCNLQVVTMGDPTDPTTYNTVQTFVTDGSYTWTEQELQLSNLPGAHRYVAFVADGNSSSSYCYIDDVILAPHSNCPRPRSLTLVGSARSDSTTIAWYGNDPSIYAWDIALVQHGGNPDTCLNLISAYDSTYALTNLLNGHSYDVYVRSNCGVETSSWRGPLNFLTGVVQMNTTGVDSIVTCGAIIVDDGGVSGQYSNYCDAILLVRTPSTDSVIYITGSYYVENNWDSIFVYDGRDTNAPLLIALSGQGVIPPVVSTSNVIAIRFISDMSSTYDGFQISVSCFSYPDCYMPVALSATPLADSCILTWREMGTSTSWTIEYGPRGFTPGNGTTVYASDTTYALSGLSSNTQYDAYVWANCLNGNNSDSAMVSFLTLPGAPVSSLPYNCSFGDTAITNSWLLLNGSEPNQWHIGTAAYNGTGDNHGLYVTYDNGATNTYDNSSDSYVFAYRSFRFQPGQYAYSFDWRCDGETTYDYLRVAFVPDGTPLTAGYASGFDSYSLPAGAISLDGGSILNQHPQWTNQNGVFSITSQGIYHLVFFWHNDYSAGSQPPAAIDNLVISTNSCPGVSNLSNTSLTTTSATFTWTAGGSESSWQVRCGNTTTTVVTTTATINSLTAATNYTCYVRPICGAGDTGIAASLSFTTPCVTTAVTSQGYTEGFENAVSALPSCWSEESAGAYWAADDMTDYYGSTSTPHGGSYVMYIMGYNSDMSRLVSPIFDLSALTSPKLVFWHMQEEWLGDQDQLQVCVRSSASSQWTVLATYTSDIPSWQCDTISLAGYSTAQISFLATCNDGYGVVLDDIFIGNVTGGGTTPCDQPTGLAVGSTTATTATVTWSGSGNFEVAYRTSGASAWNSATQVSTNSHTFTGLDASTQYDWRVRKVCSASDRSTWATSTFTTQSGGGDDPTPCDTPTGLSSSDITSSSATLLWAGSGSFEVSYKADADANWSSSQSTSQASYNLSGLRPSTSYQWRVRKVCDATTQSQWATSSFTTLSDNAITAPDGLSVAIYPNPTNTGCSITIAVNGAEGPVTATLMDITGRSIRQSTQSCHTDCTLLFAMPDVPRGAYFLKVQTTTRTAIEKLIVR